MLFVRDLDIESMFELVLLHSGGCDFICWYEGPVDEFICGLLVDLRDVVWSLQCERREHKCAHL